MRRTKQYQNGYVLADRRRKTYYFRWRDATGTQKSVKLGTFKELTSLSAAKRAAEPKRIAINKAKILECPNGETLMFGKVIDAYIAEDIPKRHSTKRGYLSKIDNHIRPRWNDVDMISLAASDVEAWFKELSELSGKTKAHIRSLLHMFYDSAMRRKWLPVAPNPMSLVRIPGVTTKKTKRRGITLVQWKLLLAELSWQPMATMIATCVCLGLRCSELCGLKWGDFDFEQGLVTVQRGIVEGIVDEVKTADSYAVLPVDDLLILALKVWRGITKYSSDSDWVFADPKTDGLLPYPGRSLQQNHIKPAAVRAKICTEDKEFGWHNLRHTYKSLLADSPEVPIGVTKELMRHASITTTMDEYGQAFEDSKRKANSGVVRQLLN